MGGLPIPEYMTIAIGRFRETKFLTNKGYRSKLLIGNLDKKKFSGFEYLLIWH